MNIRTLVLALLSASFLINTRPMFAMDKAFKDLADHATLKAGQELEKAGKEIIKTLPKKIDLEFSPKSLWTSILSIAGAVSIYKGLNQIWNTLSKSDEALKAKNQDRKKLYTIGSIKVLTGLLCLGGSYATWNWK